jgi:two-component system sensor histidine kinase YesM
MFGQVKSFYLNLSIKYRILGFFYIVIIVVALALGFNFTSISRKYVVNKVSTANLGVVKQLNASISFILKDITDISTFICIDDGVQSLLDRREKDSEKNIASSLEATNSMQFVRYIMASKSYISSFILYDAKRALVYHEFTDMSIGVKESSDIVESDIYKAALSLDGTPLWFPMLTSDNTFIQKSATPQIGLCRVVKNFNNNSPFGLIVIGISQSSLKTLCANNIQNPNECIFITDNRGNIMLQAGTDISEKSILETALSQNSPENTHGSFIDSIDRNNYLITYGSIDNGWKTFYMIPMESITSEINSANNLILAILLLCLVFSLPIAAFISSYLTAPIKKLLDSMKRFQQGNFNEHVNFKYKDEIGQLGEGYNNMVRNIKELIDRAYILQIKEREAELDALQAQINPHFLYNTLDTIFWKAEKHQVRDISEMIYSLSKLFRLSLNRGMSTTLVSREKELLQHYLMLQKIRLKEKLDYEILIDDEILDFTIPKLILQPFVENAILHGLGKMENGGRVTVLGSLIGDKLQFIIEDNGVGMDQEAINKLLAADTWENAKEAFSQNEGGYAVKNVNERLKILYRENYSLEFSSVVNKGTRVTITVPSVIGCGSKEVHDDKVAGS